MRRRLMHLVALNLLSWGLVLPSAAVFAVLLPSAPARAQAPTPTAVVIEGPGLAQPVTVRAQDDSDRFKQVHSEVSWVSGRTGNAPSPDAERLGPKYVIVIQVDDQPDQRVEAYPLAVGGPRLFRPADQPRNRKVGAAWFYGRVTLPDTLRIAGVPLLVNGAVAPGAAAPGTGAGGQGGGEVVGPVNTATPAGFGEVVRDWQRGVLLVGGAALLMLVLLGAFALLVRRN